MKEPQMDTQPPTVLLTHDTTENILGYRIVSECPQKERKMLNKNKWKSIINGTAIAELPITAQRKVISSTNYKKGFI